MMSNTFPVIEKACWGFIPARGGSKSIPLKNMHLLYNRPLIDYAILAARKSENISRLICSTDSGAIQAHCKKMEVEVSIRPRELAEDMTPVLEVLLHYLKEQGARESLPEYIALIQPTSPFLLPAHIDQCIKALYANPHANSVQTVTVCSHNNHAFNQRIVDNGVVYFRFPEERKKAYNKQHKQKHWIFGNLIITKTQALLENKGIFAEPSLAIEIENPYSFDADTLEDFEFAELMIEKKIVNLSHTGV